MTATITNPPHDPSLSQSEPGSVPGSESTTEIVNSQQQEDYADQHLLPAPISVVNADINPLRPILGGKRKLDQEIIRDVNAADDDKGETLCSMCADEINISTNDCSIMIFDSNDEHIPKKQRKSVTVTKI